MGVLVNNIANDKPRRPFRLSVKAILIVAVIVITAVGGDQRLFAVTNGLDWDAFVSRFIEDYLVTHPDVAVRAGRHEFDGKLPDWSPAALKKQGDWLHSHRKRALAFNPARLGEHQRLERDYLIAVIDGNLFWLASAEWPYKNPMFYAEALDPNVYVTRECAPLPARMRAYIDYAKAVPIAVQQIRNNLRTPLPRTYIDVAKKVFAGLATFYEKDVAAEFAAVNDAKLRSEFATANAKAAQAMKRLDQWFESQRAHATENYALGPAPFLQMLKDTEGLDVSIEQLQHIGREDLDRNLRALRVACASFAPEKPIQECIAKAQADKPEGGAVAGARRQLPLLRSFVVANDLVSIPGPEEAGVAESPPYQRWNPAYIDIPGPFERGLPSVYYVAPPDPSWSKAEREAYVPGEAPLLFISVHEVWPGHFLQFLHSNRVSSKVARLFVGYGFAEGWAHYAEELMWEAGLGDGDPGVHIGQLQDALRRNVRFLSAIGLHAQGMTVRESEQMFLGLAYQDIANARQQAARGTFDPAYLNYTLGKLMIRKLRNDWTGSRGGRKAWRAFHDKLLSYGGPPIPLVREAMLGPNAGPPF